MAVQSFSTIKEILRFEGRDKLAYWRRFTMLLMLAVVIATMGLLRNSAAVIIAAMLVAPLMTPILGIASSIVMGWSGRAARLLLIVVCAAICSIALAWLIVWLFDVPRGILIPDEVLSRADPGTEDLVIALAAGVAGAFVQIRKSEVSLLPGAAIGVSLVPPLSASGILLYFGHPWRAYEAALLFGTNFGAIILSACVVYVFLGPGGALFRAGWRSVRFAIGFALTALCLVLFFVQLFFSTFYRYQEGSTEAELTRRIHDWAGDTPVEVVRVDVQAREKLAEVWAIVDLPADTQSKVASTEDMLPPELKETPFREIAREVLGSDYRVIVRYQTRIAWLIDLKDNSITAVPVDEPSDD